MVPLAGPANKQGRIVCKQYMWNKGKIQRHTRNKCSKGI